MPPVGFGPTFSAGERTKTHALDRAATGTGTLLGLLSYIINLPAIFNQELHSFQNMYFGE
jgi:hypothetical protein